METATVEQVETEQVAAPVNESVEPSVRQPEAAAVTPIEPKTLKGVGKIPLKDVPLAFKKNTARHIKGKGQTPFQGKIKPWFFYTEGSVGTNKTTGEPNPPGCFAIFWVSDPDQGGAYSSIKTLLANPANFIANEFARVDVDNGIYSEADWAGLQWGARKALGVKVGDHPTRPKKVREQKTKYYRGLLVGLRKKLKTGEYSIEFREGTHEACPPDWVPVAVGAVANVPADCLTDDRQSSLEIETPPLVVVHTATIAKQAPYVARFDLGAFEDAS